MSCTKPVLDSAPFLERCFLFDAVESTCEAACTSGEVPGWLQGTCFINGPARFQRNDLRYKHWLDGDGMIYKLQFGKTVQFASRFIRTRKFLEEERAGRPIYRCFGTRFPGDRLRRDIMLEPPVNVSIFPFAGKLLAFGEQTLPYAVDAGTLETEGEYDFGGRLTEVSPFSAHPKFDPATGHMFNFGIAFSPTQPSVVVYEFDSVGQLVRRRRVPVQHPHSNHDFGITPNHVVFYLSPLLMDFEKFWRDGLSIMESLYWDPDKGSRILVVPWTSSEAPFAIEVGSGKCLHLINAFEEESVLVVDVLELEAPAYPEYEVIPDVFIDISPCRPIRYRIDRQARRLIDRTAMEYCLSPDFPALDRTLIGRSYSDFWMLGMSAAGRQSRKFFDQLAHGSWALGAVHDVYQAPAGVYLAGEPIFVPKPGAESQEAVVITQRLIAGEDRAEFVIFDAYDVAAGPIAVLNLEYMVHPGFHSSFVPFGHAT